MIPSCTKLGFKLLALPFVVEGIKRGFNPLTGDRISPTRLVAGTIFAKMVLPFRPICSPLWNRVQPLYSSYNTHVVQPVMNQIDSAVVQPAVQKWKQIHTTYVQPKWKQFDTAVVQPGINAWNYVSPKYVQPVLQKVSDVHTAYVQPTWNCIDESAIQPALRRANESVILPAQTYLDQVIVQPLIKKWTQLHVAAEPKIAKVVEFHTTVVQPKIDLSLSIIGSGLGYLESRRVALVNGDEKLLEKPIPVLGDSVDLTFVNDVAIPLSFVAVPFTAFKFPRTNVADQSVFNTAVTASALYQVFVRQMLPRSFSYEGYKITLGGANFMYFGATTPIPPGSEKPVIRKAFYPEDHTTRHALYTHCFVVGMCGEAANAVTGGGLAPVTHGLTAFFAIYPPAQKAVRDFKPIQKISNQVADAIVATQKFAIEEIDLALQALIARIVDESKPVEIPNKLDSDVDTENEIMMSSRSQQSTYNKWNNRSVVGSGLLGQLKRMVNGLVQQLEPTQPKSIKQMVNKHVTDGVMSAKNALIKISPKSVKEPLQSILDPFSKAFANFHARQISNLAITARGGVVIAPTRIVAFLVVTITTQVVVMRLERKYLNFGMWDNFTQHSPLGAVAFVLAGGPEQAIGEVALRSFAAMMMVRNTRTKGMSVMMMSTMINYALALYNETIKKEEEEEQKKGPQSVILTAFQSFGKVGEEFKVASQAASLIAVPVATVFRRTFVGEGNGEQKALRPPQTFNFLTMQEEDMPTEFFVETAVSDPVVKKKKFIEKQVYNYFINEFVTELVEIDPEMPELEDGE